jgi:hypothetical protein
VLEHVGEPRFAWNLVATPDAVPDLEGDHRRLVILEEEDTKAVGEGFLAHPILEAGWASAGVRGGDKEERHEEKQAQCRQSEIRRQFFRSAAPGRC